ncbi:hypothetical protein ACFV3F_43125 [Streptomyces sp. NPDC059717]|uniref:hypothetical protein n=1 Tax=Streptomyces sp. NPDC059717 TaxID=3346922 RepID=UPI0036ADCF28
MQRELQIGLIGQPHGPMPIGARRRLPPRAAIREMKCSQSSASLDALFRGAKPLVAVAELGNVLEEVDLITAQAEAADVPDAPGDRREGDLVVDQHRVLGADGLHDEVPHIVADRVLVPVGVVSRRWTPSGRN